jgi:thioredoxin 1
MAEDFPGSNEQSSTQATDITDQTAFDQLVQREEQVLVDFYADWCGPCQLMAAIVEEIAAETDLSVVKVDVEEMPQVAHQYDVQSIPTFLGIRGGNEIDRLVGMQNKGEIERLFE